MTSGEALKRFEAIRQLQGERTSPPVGSHVKKVLAENSGMIDTISNKVIGRIALLAGAPNNPGAGVHLAKHVNDYVTSGDTLLTIYADSDEALAYAARHWEDRKGSSISIS